VLNVPFSRSRREEDDRLRDAASCHPPASVGAEPQASQSRQIRWLGHRLNVFKSAVIGSQRNTLAVPVSGVATYRNLPSGLVAALDGSEQLVSLDRGYVPHVHVI